MSLRGVLYGMILSAIVLVAPAAKAQPVDLTCKQTNSSAEGRVTFDENAGTAGFAAFGNVPSSPATFTDKQITWDYKYPNGRTYFTLSRTTGTLQESGAENWHCEVAQTKF